MKHARCLLPSIVAAAVLPTLGPVGCGGSSDASIGGSITGLASGTTVVLQDNGGDDLTLGADGGFSFPTKVGSGDAYVVTVLTQPAGQVCTVAGGSGSVDSSGDDVGSVTVSCVSTSTIEGTVSGLAAGTAVTLSDGQVLLPIAVNGPFSFPGPLSIGTNYVVTVATQPIGETCAILNGSGTVTANVAVDITVSCAP